MRKKRYLPTSTTTYSGSDKEQTAESGLLPNRNHLDTMPRPRGHSNDLYRIARAPLLLCCLLRFGGCLGFSPWIPGGASTVVRHRLAAASGDGAAATTQTVDLSSGTLAEVMSLVPPASSSQGRSPLVFIHGSFHSAWCWAENYFEHFESLGYPCVAISLRGTRGTFAGDGVTKVKINDHVSDLDALLEWVVRPTSDGGMGLGGEGARQPVLISHSFGGLAVMKLLEQDSARARDRLGGVVFLCSVPPSGNGKMTMRFLRRSLRDSWKITAGLAMKKCNTDAALCRDLFFGGGNGAVDNLGVSEGDIARYQSYFQRDVDATIDLGDLAGQLPITSADGDGRANYALVVPPSLVVGAIDDFIVDREGVEETAKFFGVEPVFVDSPHDIMLTNKWKNGADAIESWLKSALG